MAARIELDAIAGGVDVDRSDFRPTIEPQPTWCPGCGDFGVQNALQQALSGLDIDPEEVLLVTGIGCSGKLSSYVGTYGFHGVHGRALPAANGAKLANPELTVIAAGGDGDGYGIGAGHLANEPRTNADLTYIVFNNEIFGLTKGQTSPTSPEGHVSSTQPEGSSITPVRPLETSLAAGSTFIARTATANPTSLKAKDVVAQAIQHPGFAHVDFLTQCPTWNKDATRYITDIVADVEDEYDFDPTDRAEAMEVIRDVEDRAIQDGELVLGVFYRDPDSVPYHERRRRRNDYPTTNPVRDILEGMASDGEGWTVPGELLDPFT